VVAPEERRRAQELFSRKILGTESATDTTAVLVSADGTRAALELSSVPLRNGDRIIGVFGLLSGPPDEAPPTAHPRLTPRQAEVVRLWEQGRSTKEVARELHITTETVRNHAANIFRALGVHSKLEALAAVRRG
jgi:DNA-binding CsgD family transcriptional regulator